MTATIDKRNESDAAGVGAAHPAGEESDIVERIIDELEPVMALQRHAMAHVWHDRSISKANMHVLFLLDQIGPLPMSRLATLVDVSFPSLTGIVDRMEELGLVARERDEIDRRVVLVHMADRGRQTVEELQQARRDLLRRVFHAMEPKDRRSCLQVVQMMHRIVDALEPEGHGPWPCARPDVHRAPATEPAEG